MIVETIVIGATVDTTMRIKWRRSRVIKTACTRARMMQLGDRVTIRNVLTFTGTAMATTVVTTAAMDATTTSTSRLTVKDSCKATTRAINVMAAIGAITGD